MILMPTKEELEKLSYEELVAERRLIVRYINEYERDFDMKNLVWGCKPGPDVHYQVYLDYLGVLCPIISRKYNEEYVRGSKNVYDYYEEMRKINKQETKIVSYNISNCTQEKIERLFELKSDIYVVPEITWESEIKLKKGFEMVWSGNSTGGKNPKGLGLIWKKGDAYVPAWYNEKLSFAIPLCYKDFLIIGIWPTKINENKNKTYLQIAEEILKYYVPHFTEKTIVVGDFNLYHKEEAKNPDANLIPVNELLESYGFKSLYHKSKNESLGHESRATYYHQFKEEQPFFLDYAYSNFSVKEYDLFDLGRDMSDHVGQVIQI